MITFRIPVTGLIRLCEECFESMLDLYETTPYLGSEHYFASQRILERVSSYLAALKLDCDPERVVELDYQELTSIIPENFLSQHYLTLQKGVVTTSDANT